MVFNPAQRSLGTDQDVLVDERIPFYSLLGTRKYVPWEQELSYLW